jgi:hypothetical protein
LGSQTDYVNYVVSAHNPPVPEIRKPYDAGLWAFEITSVIAKTSGCKSNNMRGVENMNAPNIEAQNTSRQESRSNSKVKKEGEMSIMIGIKQAASWIHHGLGKITPGAMVRGVTLGILLTVGTGIYLSMDSDITSEATSTTAKNVNAAYRFMDLEDEPLSVEFLRTYVYPEEAAMVKASAKSVNTEFRFMDLEDEPLSVEFLRTYVYPEEAAHVKAPAKSGDTEYRFMDLEDEPLSVEFLRTYVYPKEAGR